MTREPINVEGAPPAVGPYSHAVKAQGTLHFCSGQIPLTAEGQLIAGPVAAQTEQVFENIKTVLAGMGLGLENVVKTTVFLSDMALLAEMNEVYARYFQAPFPARSTVAVKGLPRNVDVEIEVIAVS